MISNENNKRQNTTNENQNSKNVKEASKKSDLKETNNLNNERNKKRHFTRTKLVLIIALITAIAGYVILRGNYLEMKELGEEYLPIFWRNLTYTVITFFINFTFLFCSFYFTNRTIRKGLKVFFDDEKKQMPKIPNKSISFIIALLGSIFTTKILLNQALLCFSNSKVGIKDPVFNLDISFMMFQKPFIQFLLIYLLVVTIGTIVYALLYSIIVLNISFEGVSRESITKCDLAGKVGLRVKIIATLAALFVIVFMVLNIGNENFMGIALNDGTSISLFGAGKVDATIKLWGYAILSFLAMISILRGYKALKNKNLRGVLSNIIIVPIFLILLALILAFYQLLFIGSNSLEKNEKYIEANIKNTKDAYGIVSEEKTIEYSGTITENEVNSEKELLNNIDIITDSNVLQDLKTSKTTKGYYTYRQTQIEQYNIQGVDTLVYITPREISNNNTTYANKTYQYTHGYGVVVTPAGETDEYGNVKNIESDFGDLSNEVISITEPRIYYGLENNNAAVIKTAKAEFDYIDEDSNIEIEYSYKGTAGLNLNFIDRLILGIKAGDINLAFSATLTDDSKIITNRNIIERAKTAMPYLKYEKEPYIVIDDSGKLFWVLDAYTVSNNYPFAQKTVFNDNEVINYIRNSVKVIINAYDGTMKFYITDRNDPIAMAYNKIYPDLFEPQEQTIPEDISKHFVYPKTLFNIQAKIVGAYHNIKPEVLFRGNDIWDIAKTSTSGKEEKIEPYYAMIKDADNNNSIGLILPYSNYGKQNLVSYMIGTYENGKETLKINRFSSDSNVLGPIQLETQINQDENIASDIASLNTTGTKITKKMTAIPINNTVIYVETVYQQLINETIQRPTLKRVVVASGNKVAIGENLQSALRNLLSKYAVDIDVSNSEDMQDLVKAIIKSNQDVKDSSKNGDWKLYGEDMQTLTGLIDQLQNLVEKQEKEEIENVTQNSENTVENMINNI